MAKDEFSVNELEPERNTNEVVEETTQMEYTEGSEPLLYVLFSLTSLVPYFLLLFQIN